MLHAAVNKKNPDEFLAKRKYYDYFCRSLNYSFIGTKEQVEKRIKTVKKNAPDADFDFDVRPLTESETKEYNKTMIQEATYKNLRDSSSSVYVFLRDNGASLQISFKKNKNKTDKALRQLFEKMGLTIYKNTSGHEYVMIKR